RAPIHRGGLWTEQQRAGHSLSQPPCYGFHGTSAPHRRGNGWDMINLKSLALAAAALALAGIASAQTAQPAATRPIVNAPPPIDAPALIGPAPAVDSVRAAADRLSMRGPVSAERLTRANADNPWTPWVAMQPVFGATFTEQRLPRTARVFA